MVTRALGILKPSFRSFPRSLLLLLFLVWLGLWLKVLLMPLRRPLRLANRHSISFICITSTPSRLREPWIVNNILRLSQLPGHAAAVISLPYILARTGEMYEVPHVLQTAPGLIILRCDDAGPGTKLLAPLRSELLPPDAILLCCDDDMVVHSDAFQALASAVESDPAAVHCFCLDKLQGFLGFGGYKRAFLPLLDINMPDSCRTIDDDFFQASLERLGVPRRVVKLPNCLSVCQTCVFDVPQAAQRLLTDAKSLTMTEIFLSSKRRRRQKACLEALSAAKLPST